MSADGLLDSPHGIVRRKGTLFVANQVGSVIRVELGNGEQTMISLGDVGGRFVSANGIALEPSSILVTDLFIRAVIRVDPETGDQDFLSVRGLLSGPMDFLREDENHVIIPDYFDGTIVRVDLTTGDQTIAHAIPGDGLYGIAREPSGTYVVGDRGGDRIYRVDLAAGTHEVLSEGGLLVNSSGIAVVPEWAELIPALGRGALAGLAACLLLAGAIAVGGRP